MDNAAIEHTIPHRKANFIYERGVTNLLVIA